MIFLDVDGVLADFVGGVHKALNGPVPYPWKTQYDNWNWHLDQGWSVEQVDTICTIEFWANLEWMKDGKAILNSVLKHCKATDIYLLTIPMSNYQSASGKILWIRKNIPWLEKQAIITASPKSLFARSDRILIDDKADNVTKFVEAGGRGILVPRYWNYRYPWVDAAAKLVDNRLKYIFAEHL